MKALLAIIGSATIAAAAEGLEVGQLIINAVGDLVSAKQAAKLPH